jgi:hypothetical protein
VDVVCHVSSISTYTPQAIHTFVPHFACLQMTVYAVLSQRLNQLPEILTV